MSPTPFHGTSEMARRMRALDWSKTALGPVDTWPSPLRTCVSTCLDCAFPIVLWWGPQLSILYNDEYIDFLGEAKHPKALGRPGAEVWAEIWDVIEPMLSQVMTMGEPTRSRDLLLHIDRGYLEETYFSFSYSPIHNDDGTVGGVFCPVIETTDKVIGARRLRTLRDLAATTKGPSGRTTLRRAAATLAANPTTCPSRSSTGEHERAPSGRRGGIASHRGAPERVSLDEPAIRGRSPRVGRVGPHVLLTDLAPRFDSSRRARGNGAAQRARATVLLPGRIAARASWSPR
jgi:hypothetical protein